MMRNKMMAPLAIVLGAGAPVAMGQQTVTQWTGAINGLWSESGNWTAGVPSNGVGTFAAIIDTASGFAQLDTNVTIDRALIGPTSAVRINNGRILGIVAEPDPQNPSGMTGILAIDNLLTIDTFNVATRIRMDGAGQLLITPGSTPTGRIETSNSTANLIEGIGVGTQTVVFAPGFTFSGAGNVGNNTVRVDNRGVIEASLPAGLTVDAGDGELAFNSGVLSAIGASTLRIQGTDLDNTLGIIEASDTAGVRIEGGSSVLGGVLRTFGDGQILPQSGSEFDGVTIAPGSTVNQNNGVLVDLFNDLVNDGTWTMNVVSIAVQLFTNGDFTIDGDGEIVMSDSTANIIRPRNSGQTITHAASHTIRGSGTLLSNVGGMVNNGAILAGPGAQPIVIDPQSDMDFVNNGTLQANGPGGLQFNAGTFVNTDNTIDIDPGSRLQVNSGARVVGGTLRSAGDGQILLQSGSVFDGVTIAPGSTVNQNNGVSVDLFNDLVNDGTWTMNLVNIAVQIFTNGDFTIDGDGEIVMSNSTANFIRPRNSGETITHAASHTIRGSGTLLSNVGGMVNNGAILAGPGTQPIVIDPQNDMDFVNNGTLQANGPGGLQFNAGTFVNTANTIDIAPGSRLQVSAGASVVGGTLRSAGDGQILLQSGSEFDGVTIAPGSIVNQNNGVLVDLFNDLVNDGTWTMNVVSIAVQLFTNGDFTIDGDGEIVMSDSTANIIRPRNSSETITHAASHTIRGSGTLLSNVGGMVNNGAILAGPGTQPIVIDPQNDMDFVNNGTLQANGPGGLQFNAGTFVNTANTIDIAPGSRLQVSAGARVVGGTLRSAGDGQILLQSGSEFDGVTIASGSTVNQNNGVSVDLFNDLVNDGTWTMNLVNIAVQIFTNGDFTIDGDGEIVMSNSTANFIRPRNSGETITHAAGHTIRGSGTLLNNLGGMVNNGAILAGPGAQPIVIDPQSDMSFVNNPGGVLGGTGRLVMRDGTLDNRGTISPGFSPGRLTIDAADVDNAPSAVLRAELAGTDPGDGFDVLEVTGAYNAGGEIVVLLIEPFEPGPADSFEIVTAGSVAGFFANADPGGDDVASGVISGNAEFDVVYGPGTITLTNVRPAPEPCSPADVSSGARPGIPDGQLDANDFFFYLDRFAAGDLIADLTGSAGVPDGVLDVNDFFAYLSLFADGCP